LEKKGEPESTEKVPTLAEIRAAMRTENALLRAEAPLREEFPEADKTIFSRIEDFDSVEALRAAVETSHLKAKSEKDKMREEVTAEVLKDVGDKYGLELTPADPPSGETGSGDPTVEQLNAMSQVQLDALEAKNPGIIARVTGLDQFEGGGWSGGA